MRDEHLDRLDSFRIFLQAIEEGSPVPPVNADDLKRLHEMSEYVSKQAPDSEGALSIDTMAQVCSPDANVPAVWFRHTRLRSLIRRGILSEWQHGANLDNVAYHLAATIPMNGLQLDENDFIERLRYEAAV